jgi:uncharacterized protein YcbX
VSAAPPANTARIAALYVYPVKSARGIAVADTQLTAAGLAQDRRWMIVGDNGHCITQRELPRLALLVPSLSPTALRLRAPAMPELCISLAQQGERRPVTVWQHRCEALDEGSAAARWLQHFLGEYCRLVRFDPAHRRLSSPEWTGGRDAPTQFADAFALLALSSASLDELNSRLSSPLPMNRFRPNIVLEGLNAFDEDRIEELSDGAIRLRPVKPCTRCKITTTNQDTGCVEGDEPLRTLKSYRYDAALHGVCFGQNMIVAAGAGARLRRGQTLQLRWKP